MMGYGERTKGYRLYNCAVFFSRDVVFNERIPRQEEESGSDNEVKAVESASGKPEHVSGGESLDDEEREHGERSEDTEIPREDTETPRRRRQLPETPRQRSRILPEKPTRLSERIRSRSEQASLAMEEHRTRREALATPEAKQWSQAMAREMESLSLNEVWTLTNLPKGKRAVGSRWVYKTKTGPGGEVLRHKARLVARRFSQQPGTDYDQTFSPVVWGESIRMLLAMAAQENLELHQMDVETAFLNGTLQEEVYMEQPEGYTQQGKEHQVCRLHKSIYGLK